MKKQALLFFALSICAFGQGVRYDVPPILNSRAVLVPNANISLCPGTATITNSTCSPASTQAFTDITLTTPCATGSPVVLPQTSVCSGVADSLGNAGFWLAPGAYIYCINGPSITGKCYNLTVPVGATSGGGLISPSVNGIVDATAQAGATIDAKVAAAYTAGNCATNYCTIRISAPGPSTVTVNLPTGSVTLPTWNFSSGISFATPVNLECGPGVWLNWTGSGNGITQGPNGLTINTRNPLPYIVNGCGFTGGTTAGANIIYHNRFVIKSYVLNSRFVNAGNTTGSNIFFQAENWYSHLQNIWMWSEATGVCYNGITVNDVATDNTTYDNGDSFVRFLGVHIQNLNNTCTTTTGINVNSFNADFDQVDILGGFANSVRLRKGANSATFKKYYSEVVNNGCSILYGDLSTDPAAAVNNFIDALTIKDNSYINVHNTDFATTAHPVCPATATSGLQNTLLDNLSVSNITSGQPVVQMNNLVSQVGNCANFTRYTSSGIAAPFGVALGSKLHTTGANITQWCGTDEGMTAYSYLNVNGINASNNSITANNGQDAQNNIVLQAGATADQDENFIFNSHTGGINGRINFATSARMNLFVGAVNAFQLTSSGVLPQLPIQAAGVAAGLTGTGACATITTTAGGSFAGTGKCTGTTGASTLTITFTLTATNGYVCDVWDETNRANVFQQTSHSPTTCVLTVTSVTQNDVFVFKAIAF